MSSPRLSPAPGPYGPEADESLAALMPPGVEPLRLFRTLGHNPRVLTRFLAGGLLDKGSISLRDRELAVLRTTARCGSGPGSTSPTTPCSRAASASSWLRTTCTP